jgi:pimeloyl-ACP methyl ester carboxylesterase
LPGFGFSERADREYSPELYAQAVIDLLERVGQPSDVVALSLGSEFAALAALERPELFHSLTMISPSGFSLKGASQRASAGGMSDLLYQAFSFQLWGQAFYDLLATRTSIRWFLQQSFEGEVDAGLEAYGYQTTHQPGAHYAPLYFVSGKLFTPGIRERVYEKLKLPVLVLYDRDFYVSFDRLPEVVARYSNWRAARIAPTLGLPQFERMPEVARALDQFWAQITAAEQSH